MSLNFYLGELLQRRYEQLGKNWRAVSRDMRARTKNASWIDRRKLPRLAACDSDVRLTIAEMTTLQEYLVLTGLARYHENPFFRPSSTLLDALRAESDLTVFYPSRPLQDFATEGASRWDLRAIQVLNKAPEIGSLHFSFEDVFHHGPTYADGQTLREHQAKQRWFRVLDEEQSLISIGAPFACYATEEILSRMFDVTPYEPYGLHPQRRLPFYLYWPQAERSSDSAFAVSREELEEHFPEQFARMGPQTRAVLVGDELYPAPQFGESMNLIVAQYWRGHVAMVLLGVYAPSTLAIARFLAEGKVTESLGPYRYTPDDKGARNESQPILINKIKTTIAMADDDGDSCFSVMKDKRRPAAVRAAGWERWHWGGERFELSESGAYEEAAAGH